MKKMFQAKRFETESNDLVSLNRPLREIIRILQIDESVFEKLGFDSVGQREEPFDEVCDALQLDPATLVLALAASSQTKSSSPIPVELMSLSELCDHLQKDHHGVLQTELSRLDLLLAEAEKDGNSKKPSRIRERFDQFRAELSAHLREEAEVLFPLIRQLDEPRIARTGVMDLLQFPLLKMKEEHAQVDEELSLLEKMAAEAGVRFRHFHESLQQLEERLHGQIYQENQILFRRVFALIN